MPFSIQTNGNLLALELNGELTIRHAQDLHSALAAQLCATTQASLRASHIEDIDTSILQLLVSLRKTASSFTVEDCSPQFLTAVDRAGLRRELLAGAAASQESA